MDNAHSDSLADQSTHASLIRLAQGGGPEAQLAAERLIAKFNPLIVAAVRKLIKIPTLRDDALQAARLGFLEALRRANPDHPRSFGNYARKYVEGAVQDQQVLEYKYRHHVITYSELPSAQEHDEAQDFDAHIGGAEDPNLERVEDWAGLAVVHSFVRSLPPGPRRLVWDVYWRGHSQAEVAKARGISRAAINKALDRICRRARDDLSAAYAT